MKNLAISLILAASLGACKKRPKDVPPPVPKLAVLHTTKGDVVLKLFGGQAPETARNFASLSKERFYDGMIFHRVIAELLVQTGDPKGDGTGGSGKTIPDELGGKFDRPGLVGMARWGPGSASSQFFITLKAMPDINGQNALFAEVVEGLEVVRAISKVPRDETDGKDRPLDPPVLKSIELR